MPKKGAPNSRVRNSRAPQAYELEEMIRKSKGNYFLRCVGYIRHSSTSPHTINRYQTAEKRKKVAKPRKNARRPKIDDDEEKPVSDEKIKSPTAKSGPRQKRPMSNATLSFLDSGRVKP